MRRQAARAKRLRNRERRRPAEPPRGRDCIAGGFSTGQGSGTWARKKARISPSTSLGEEPISRGATEDVWRELITLVPLPEPSTARPAADGLGSSAYGRPLP